MKEMIEWSDEMKFQSARQTHIKIHKAAKILHCGTTDGRRAGIRVFLRTTP